MHIVGAGGGVFDGGRKVVGTPEAVEVAEGINTFGFVVAAIELGGGFVFGCQETELDAVFGFEQDELDAVGI